MLYCIHSAAVGFIGCSAVRQPSWLSEFSEFDVAGGWLAGWIRWQCQISDINHHPLLLLLPPLPPLSAVSPFYSPLLLSASSSSSVLPLLWSLSTQLTPCIAIHPVFLSIQLPSPSFYPLCFSNTHAYTGQKQTGRQCRLCYEWHPLAHPEEVYALVWLYKLSPLSSE